MDTLTIYEDNDAYIEVKGLLNRTTGAFVENATMAVTLKTLAGAEVAGQTWPLTMSFVTGTNGVYRATMPSTLDVTQGTSYTAVITADGGPGLLAKWEIDVQCQKRRG